MITIKNISIDTQYKRGRERKITQYGDRKRLSSVLGQENQGFIEICGENLKRAAPNLMYNRLLYQIFSRNLSNGFLVL